MDDKNKIDVSQEACDKRATERRMKEAKFFEKMARAFCRIAGFCLILFIALIFVTIIESLSIIYIIVTLVIAFFSLYLGGCALEKKKEIEAMSNEEYIEEQTKALKRSNADQTVCPCWGLTHVTFHEKGFNEGKAMLGIALIGFWGAFWGVPGKNKIKGTCLEVRTFLDCQA